MKKLICIISVTGMVLVSACKKKEGPQGPQGPAGPSLSGNLVGYVEVYDSYGVAQKADSVVVSIVGKPFSVLTDTLGKFLISGLSTGVYEVDVSKTNYQSSKIASLNFVGGGTQYITNKIAITQVPSFTISSIGFSNTFGNITYTVTAANSDSKARKAIIFFSKNTNVSSSPPTYAGTMIVNIPQGSSNAIGAVSGSTLSQLGFNSGDVVYAIAYPISNANMASVYFDTNTGKLFYNNINTSGGSSVVNFMVP
ncbi:MAG: hypothetical protein KatS3mg028_1317 [Bacteroidia bacterium]|nr:MAG: hypothetical protein KatS3mg028_1317 [Bacteroidia bacterium]